MLEALLISMEVIGRRMWVSVKLLPLLAFTKMLEVCKWLLDMQVLYVYLFIGTTSKVNKKKKKIQFHTAVWHKVNFACNEENNRK